MARFGFPDLKIELDINSGGALGDISAYVTEISDRSIEAILEEITAAGDTVDNWAAVGITKKGEITLTGPYDNTADKLVLITNQAGDVGETRTLKLTYDGATAADVLIVEAIIKSTSHNASRDALHAYSVVLQPTGAIT
jgi:hypothetical protein